VGSARAACVDGVKFGTTALCAFARLGFGFH
jgi:hypothetical protein